VRKKFLLSVLLLLDLVITAWADKTDSDTFIFQIQHSNSAAPAYCSLQDFRLAWICASRAEGKGLPLKRQCPESVFLGIVLRCNGVQRWLSGPCWYTP
jgi:hypothetical protein